MTVSVTFTAPIVEDNMYYGGVITIWAIDNHNDNDSIAVNINVANHSAIKAPSSFDKAYRYTANALSNGEPLP